MKNEPPIKPELIEAFKRISAEFNRGDRDARRAINERQIKAAARAASPAGLLAIFPALKVK